MNPMIERVARAMQESAAWPAVFAAGSAETLARAAIQAMREPTEPMIAASNREWDGRMSHRSSGAWQAMIDAILATRSESGEQSRHER